MNDFLQGIRQRLFKVNLTQRLVLSLVLVVLVTVMFSTLPANLILWRQLERQVWQSVQNAQAATQTLYGEETIRLKKLSGLLAERPTLYRLVQAADLVALEPYLQTLKESSDADVLLVVTPDWQLGDDLPGLPQPVDFLQGTEPYFADFMILGDTPHFYIVAVSQIPPEIDDQPLLGYVLLAREMDDDQMIRLAQGTGLAQSLLIEGQRIATSLSQAPVTEFDAETAEQVLGSGLPATVLGRADGETYYLGLAPLHNARGEVLALSEVALAGNTIRRGMLSAFALSTGVVLLVILIGTAVLIRLTRTITEPLEQLTRAAEQASLGNLAPPGLPHSDIPEVNQLARHLDRARRQLRQILTLTQREMKHAERLLASVREGVASIDDQGRITFFNHDAEQITGHHSENVLHRSAAQLFPPAPDERLSLSDLLGRSASEAQAERLNVLDARGRPLLLSTTLSPAAPDLEDGDHMERVLVFRDVTEEEAVNRLRYNFLANVAHEFRTPLSGIAATTELLVEEGDNLTGEELAGLVDTISLCTLHLQTLVDNLLESTTIEAGVFQVHRRPIQFSEVVQGTVELMKPLVKRRDQNLRVELPKELPTLWADPHRLTQVLVNLISNASRFSPMGGQIVLSVAQDEKAMTVAVLDDGPGLPVGQYADLFNRFVTGSTPGEAQYGIGLGLSVVKSIVEMHGGQVGAQNRHLGGAQVWFTLPIQPPQEGEDV